MICFFLSEYKPNHSYLRCHPLCHAKVTLETGPTHLASEYFTSEEMVSFKKPKKRKKVRKKEKVKADDLLPLGDDDLSKDHGSRSRYNKFSLCVFAVDDVIVVDTVVCLEDVIIVTVERMTWKLTHLCLVSSTWVRGSDKYFEYMLCF